MGGFVMHFGKFCYRVNCCSWTIELATHGHRAERYILDLTADCWNVRFTPFGDHPILCVNLQDGV